MVVLILLESEIGNSILKLPFKQVAGVGARKLVRRSRQKSKKELLAPQARVVVKKERRRRCRMCFGGRIHRHQRWIECGNLREGSNHQRWS